MNLKALLQMKKQEIPTPALVVDLDKLNRNIDRMAERARSAGIALRPHIKTHKTPIISQMQMRAGAVGITCAKLGEAEVMAAAGIEDIWICYPIVGADKVDRLLNLARWVPRISTTVDTFEAMRVLNRTAQERNQFIDVMVEVDVGYRRTGVLPGEKLIALVKEIVQDSPGLRYKGLMYIAGTILDHLEPDKQLAVELAAIEKVTGVADSLKKEGIDTPVISGGTTPGSRYLEQLKGINEYRVGCYVFGDMKYADAGAHTRNDMALTVLTTVVSIPEVPVPTHFVVDAGSKTLTHSGALTSPGYGTVAQNTAWTVNSPSEEHGAIYISPGDTPPKLGSKIDLYPNYVSDVVNLADELWVVQGEDVIAVWDILARGKRV